MDFEHQHVHSFYSAKADEFSRTRTKPWPFVTQFLSQLRPCDVVLDAGCGNGRHFVHPNTVGADFSAELLAVASTRRPTGLVRCDVHALPFGTGVFDAVVSIAVLHHLSTATRRTECMREMHRVLRPGGCCVVYVWHVSAAQQRRFTALSEGDYLVTWRGTSPRYYHLYTEAELCTTAQDAGFTVQHIAREEESVYVVLKK